MKEYEKPQMEIIELSGADVITASCPPLEQIPGYDDWFD